MEKSEVQSLIIDILEDRFESYVQTQIKLHQEYHEKLLLAVETQIKTTVNGKIDGIKKDIQALSEKIEPVDRTRKWFVQFKDGATWVAGFITPLAILGGAVLWFVNEIKK